ncbi:hypothetical protein HPB50_001660 [Hyalomma asiaticum]|uniref:Uncharacterized protein n=1 Tax=Hyalomma asiaticum TaxID=266040 RepID=A0ACB7RXS4_HYAAI|nr:hypothetical protein HPB50_001660 [Hyalomma asiaticum]
MMTRGHVTGVEFVNARARFWSISIRTSSSTWVRGRSGSRLQKSAAGNKQGCAFSPSTAADSLSQEHDARKDRAPRSSGDNQRNAEGDSRGCRGASAKSGPPRSGVCIQPRRHSLFSSPLCDNVPNPCHLSPQRGRKQHAGRHTKRTYAIAVVARDPLPRAASSRWDESGRFSTAFHEWARKRDAPLPEHGATRSQSTKSPAARA